MIAFLFWVVDQRSNNLLTKVVLYWRLYINFVMPLPNLRFWHVWGGGGRELGSDFMHFQLFSDISQCSNKLTIDSFVDSRYNPSELFLMMIIKFCFIFGIEKIHYNMIESQTESFEHCCNFHCAYHYLL